MHALNFEDCTDELDRYYETLDESTMPPLPQEPWDIALRLNGGDEAKALAVLALRAHQTVHDDITMLFDDREKTHVCAQRE